MKKNILHGKNIVLGICGGIAAYKSVEILRRLVKLGAKVRVIMTRSATRFVGPMTFEVLSENKVCVDLFDGEDNASIRHIAWAEEAHAVLIAPATANMVAKLAHGIADDALSTFMLAVTSPVMVCPSMNSNMFEHPAHRRNLCLCLGQGLCPCLHFLLGRDDVLGRQLEALDRLPQHGRPALLPDDRHVNRVVRLLHELGPPQL